MASPVHNTSIGTNHGVAVSSNHGTINFHQNAKVADPQEMLDWLSDVPFQMHHRRTERHIIPGTTDWLVARQEIQRWLLPSGDSNALMLSGHPGSGKSCLTARIIGMCSELAAEHNLPPPIFFYCNYNQADLKRSSPLHILLCLLRQLLEATPADHAYRAPVTKRYKSRVSQGPLDLEETVEFMHSLLSHRQEQTTVVIDALDECDENRRHELLNFLSNLLSDYTKVKVFVSCRQEVDIVQRLDDWPSICISSGDNSADIDLFIATKVDRAIKSHSLLKTARSVPPKLVAEIKGTLRAKSNGMFRWVEASIDYLCSLNTREAVEANLGKLPTSLKALYQELYTLKFANRDDIENEMTHTAFMLLLCARRMLSPDELTYLISSRVQSRTVMSTFEMQHLCFNFITVDAEQNTCVFFHASVREFLTVSVQDYLDPARLHACAAIACLNMLQCHPVPEEESDAEDWDSPRYAARDDSDKVENEHVSETSSPAEVPANPGSVDGSPSGHRTAVASSHSVKQVHDPSEQPSVQRTRSSHIEAEEPQDSGKKKPQQRQVFVQIDPNMDPSSLDFQVELSYAMDQMVMEDKFRANQDPPRLYVIENYDPAPHFQDKVEKVPPTCGPNNSDFGGKSTTSQFLRSPHLYGSRPMKDRQWRRRMRYAERAFFDYVDESWHHHVRRALSGPDQPLVALVVQGARCFVLDNKNNSRERWISRLDDKWDALARRNKHRQHVEAFHEKDLIVEPPDSIFTACVLDLQFLVEERLEMGAECLTLNNSRGLTPLIAACLNGSNHAVKAILSRKASLDPIIENGMTPLQAAASAGREELVHLLLDLGAQLDHNHDASGTALQVAVKCGRPEILQILLDSGASLEINTTGEYLLAAPKSLVGIAAYCKQVKCLDMMLRANLCTDQDSLEDAILQNIVPVVRGDQLENSLSDSPINDEHEMILDLLLEQLGEPSPLRPSPDIIKKAFSLEAGLDHVTCVKKLLASFKHATPLDLMLACFNCVTLHAGGTLGLILEELKVRPHTKIVSDGLNFLLIEAAHHGTLSTVQAIISHTFPEDFFEQSYIAALEPSSKVLAEKNHDSQKFLEILRFMPSHLFEQVFDGLVYIGAVGPNDIGSPMADMLRENFPQRLAHLVEQDPGLHMLLPIRWGMTETPEQLAPGPSSKSSSNIVVMGNLFVHACKHGLQLAAKVFAQMCDSELFGPFFCSAVTAALKEENSAMVQILLDQRTQVAHLTRFQFALSFLEKLEVSDEHDTAGSEAERLVLSVCRPILEELSAIQQPERGEIARANIEFAALSNFLLGQGLWSTIPQLAVWSSGETHPPWFTAFMDQIIEAGASWTEWPITIKRADDGAKRAWEKHAAAEAATMTDILNMMRMSGMLDGAKKDRGETPEGQASTVRDVQDAKLSE